MNEQIPIKNDHLVASAIERLLFFLNTDARCQCVPARRHTWLTEIFAKRLLENVQFTAPNQRQYLYDLFLKTPLDQLDPESMKMFRWGRCHQWDTFHLPDGGVEYFCALCGEPWRRS